MRKTSVYLSEEEAEGLRKAALATGRSQAEVVRGAIRRELMHAGVQKRRFHSLGKGHGGGRPYEEWGTEELYSKVMGHE